MGLSSSTLVDLPETTNQNQVDQSKISPIPEHFFASLKSNFLSSEISKVQNKTDQIVYLRCEAILRSCFSSLKFHDMVKVNEYFSPFYHRQMVTLKRKIDSLGLLEHLFILLSSRIKNMTSGELLLFANDCLPHIFKILSLLEGVPVTSTPLPYDSSSNSAIELAYIEWQTVRKEEVQTLANNSGKFWTAGTGYGTQSDENSSVWNRKGAMKKEKVIYFLLEVLLTFLRRLYPDHPLVVWDVKKPSTPKIRHYSEKKTKETFDLCDFSDLFVEEKVEMISDALNETSIQETNLSPDTLSSEPKIESDDLSLHELKNESNLTDPPLSINLLMNAQFTSLLSDLFLHSSLPLTLHSVFQSFSEVDGQSYLQKISLEIFSFSTTEILSPMSNKFPVLLNSLQSAHNSALKMRTAMEKRNLNEDQNEFLKVVGIEEALLMVCNLVSVNEPLKKKTDIQPIIENQTEKDQNDKKEIEKEREKEKEKEKEGTIESESEKQTSTDSSKCYVESFLSSGLLYGECDILTLNPRYKYKENALKVMCPKNTLRRIIREQATMNEHLPLHESSSVFLRVDENRPEVMQALITGYFCFLFLFYCFIVLLFYCFIVLLFYCFIVLLFYIVLNFG
jgi:hypothetical protein